MKKLFVTFLLGLLIFTGFSQRQNPVVNPTLILVHPTEYNIKMFNYLIENRIVNIENLMVIGVYHEKEVYDYSASYKYLENNNLGYFKMQKITEDIQMSDIFVQNNCSNRFEELFQKSNGILFLGGPDLPPAIYGEETSLLTEISDPYRHYFEVSFLFHLIGGNHNPAIEPFLNENPYYTVYGICLGMQTINVAAGGTMVQDIPTEIYQTTSAEKVLLLDKNNQHRNYNTNLSIDEDLFDGSFHEITLTNKEKIIGNAEIKINPLVFSIHHQAIEKLGQDLKVVATSMDGKIVEAISHKKFENVLGVQFHPERMYMHNPAMKYKVAESDSLVAGYDILKNHGSYDFHLDFWKEFSRKMTTKNQSKK